MTRRVKLRHSVTIPLLLVSSFLLLAIAWAIANPPSAGPDEPDHVLKAVVTGHGQLLGRSPAPSPAPMPAAAALPDSAVAWMRATTRAYERSPALAPPNDLPCFAFAPDTPASCGADGGRGLRSATNTEIAETQFGTYPPLFYLPAGIAMRGAHDYSDADRRGRVANALLCSGLVGWALLLAWSRCGALGLAGVCVAVTPSAIFFAAVMGTSGLQTAAAVCAWTGVAAIVLRPESKGLGPFVAAGVGGSIVALAHPLGAVIALCIVLTGMAMMTRHSMRVLLASRSRPLIVSTAAVMGSCLASLAWVVVVMPGRSFSVTNAVRDVPGALRQIPHQVQGLIGVFGWNDTTMPSPVYAFALLPVIALGVAAWRSGSASHRRGLSVAALLVGVVDVIIALYNAQIGFHMQARYVLPLAVGFPILAGFVAERPMVHERTGGHALLATLAIIASGVVQLAAFIANAHRYAVGRSGSWAIPWPSMWAPPGGLAPWLLCVTVAVSLIVGASIALFTSSGGMPSLDQ